jgi:hypothetical protein
MPTQLADLPTYARVFVWTILTLTASAMRACFSHQNLRDLHATASKFLKYPDVENLLES